MGKVSYGKQKFQTYILSLFSKNDHKTSAMRTFTKYKIIRWNSRVIVSVIYNILYTDVW